MNPTTLPDDVFDFLATTANLVDLGENGGQVQIRARELIAHYVPPPPKPEPFTTDSWVSQAADAEVIFADNPPQGCLP